jgi:hypothetical protein
LAENTQGTCSAVVGSEDGQVGEGINDADRSKLCREGGSIGRGGVGLDQLRLL